jgi:hypothetical protein
VLPTWRRQKKAAAEEQDVDDPLRSLLRKLQLKQLQKILGRALHSSTFWLNLSAFCGIGVHSGVVQGLFRR